MLIQEDDEDPVYTELKRENEDEKSKNYDCTINFMCSYMDSNTHKKACTLYNIHVLVQLAIDCIAHIFLLMLHSCSFNNHYSIKFTYMFVHNILSSSCVEPEVGWILHW